LQRTRQTAIIDLNQGSPKALLYFLWCILAPATAKDLQWSGRRSHFVAISAVPGFAGVSDRDRHRFLFIDRSVMRLCYGRR
jgi:hypothetical protein